MRKKIVAGNWKMNNGVAASIALASDIVRRLGASPSECEVVLAPVFIALESVAEIIKHTALELAAQNCHAEPDGAYTGEISARMLRELGCRYVITGHSERRQYFGETNGSVNQKVKRVLAESLRPIFCVGETLADRELGIAEDIIGEQLGEGLEGLTADDAAQLVVAYEPVWAIGTGRTASPEQAEQMHAFIRRRLAAMYMLPVAEMIPILYGGSVKAVNAKILFSMPNIDGGLIGGASLNAEEFAEIIRSI
ncbi:MAG: triose-phosphate isomerase [Rhizobacter sp.]|nr:triose-phosphate isomerase [Chlorobiales bacterium]